MPSSSPSSSSYEPRCPTAGALHRIVQEHVETFRAPAATLRDGEGLPRCVEAEFRDFLQCGLLAGGFARFQCGTCGLDRFVAVSCKGRGCCPSCGGRRMTERAAHLVEQVFPDVPIRQWVLSLPYRLRYRLAWDHDLCRGVVAVFVRVMLRCRRDRARDAGVDGGRGGAVAVVPRFGGALNLNVHVHALVLDGVFAKDLADALVFHPAPPLTTRDVAEVLATVEARVSSLLERRGCGEGDGGASEGDVWAEEAPGLAGLAAASVQGQVAWGRDRGARVPRLGDETDEDGAVLVRTLAVDRCGHRRPRPRPRHGRGRAHRLPHARDGAARQPRGAVPARGRVGFSPQRAGTSGQRVEHSPEAQAGEVFQVHGRELPHPLGDQAQPESRVVDATS